ncbi:MAG TPA: nucleoside hydrolase-like domain-containing protein [Thermoguttaceae bacterium]|nr:nucleoside hydrolase-like domain-containing protein [Thermoguttaceae bacterium]
MTERSDRRPYMQARLHILTAIAFAMSPTLLWGTAEAADLRPRLIVLTDIGGDPDDQQSMVRLMVYSNEFEIEGLIASGTPGELKEAVTRPQLIGEIVDAYGQVRGNLAQHADGYPSAEYLQTRIKAGNPQRGRDAIGEGRDTEGSRWIISVVDRPDPRPVNITIWGGQTDLAQALWRVRADRGAGGLNEFIQRIRVYDIGDQDKIVDWIWREFPGLFYVLGQAADGHDKREAVYRGMYLGGDQSLTSRDWMETHIRQEHGPLGALYPTRTWTAPNPHSAMKEGDTPSWLYFLPVGLSDPGHPDWGGWGGRFVLAEERIWRDAKDSVGEVADGRSTVWRWRDAFQRDFQARMDWCVEPREKANHAPTAVYNGDATRAVLTEQVRRGGTICLSGAGSNDPDGHELTYHWWVYPEAGTYRGKPTLDGANSPQVNVTLPPDATGEVHVILEVTDNGQPSLTSYRRVVIRVN